MSEDITKPSPGDSITLTLPEAPSANTYWRRHGNIIHVSAVAKAYKEAIRLLTLRYKRGAEVAFPSGDLRLDLTWHRSRKSGDRSNRLKVLEDALQGTIYRDDKQIACGWTERVDAHPEIPKGFMRVEISRLNG